MNDEGGDDEDVALFATSKGGDGFITLRVSRLETKCCDVTSG
jgi:hypothetical protein